MRKSRKCWKKFQTNIEQSVMEYNRTIHSVTNYAPRYLHFLKGRMKEELREEFEQKLRKKNQLI